MKVKRETELHDPGQERDKENERKARAMRLSPDVEFLEDIRLLVYRPRGLVNEAAINKVLTALEDLEARLKKPFNRFTDTVAAAEIELNFEYVIKFSLHRRLSYAGHPPVKSAILATDSTMIHYAKLHAVLTQGSSIKVRIFNDRKEAADWLEVPVRFLTPDRSNSDTR
jgi:hypothetical protein